MIQVLTAYLAEMYEQETEDLACEITGEVSRDDIVALQLLRRGSDCYGRQVLRAEHFRRWHLALVLAGKRRRPGRPAT